MTDYFALFAEPRRPWLDLDSLKTKFLTRSAEVHPDRVHQATPEIRQTAEARYTELNAAYQCLRDTKERLRHLLELEQGIKPNGIQNIPAQMSDHFMEVGQLCRSVDQFLVGKSKVTSPLLMVQCMEQGLDWTERVQTLQQKLRQLQDSLENELPALNAAWESAETLSPAERLAALPLKRLEEIYRSLSYLTRWSGQLSERMVLLAT